VPRKLHNFSGSIVLILDVIIRSFYFVNITFSYTCGIRMQISFYLISLDSEEGEVEKLMLVLAQLKQCFN